MEIELKLFQWDNATAAFMKQMVEGVPIYIADLDPDFWDVAFPVPLSSPFVSEIEPFSHPMGLRNVIRLIRDVSALRRGEEDYQSLAVDTKYARLGPGKINCTASHLHVAVYGRWTNFDMKLKGIWLGGDDRLLLVPTSVSCPPVDSSGTSLMKDAIELVKAPVEVDIRSKTMLRFRFNLTCGETSLFQEQVRACFCESPHCESHLGRFTQDAGTFALPDLSGACRGVDMLGRGAWNVSNKYAQAMLKKDGSVNVHGDSRYGGDISNVQLQLENNVNSLYAQAFATATI